MDPLDWRLISSLLTQPLGISFIFSFFAFYFTTWAIDTVAPHFIRKGLTGKDLLKKDQPIMFYD